MFLRQLVAPSGTFAVISEGSVAFEGFILYSVVVEHTRHGVRRRNYIGCEPNNAGLIITRRTNRWTRVAGREMQG